MGQVLIAGVCSEQLKTTCREAIGELPVKEKLVICCATSSLIAGFDSALSDGAAVGSSA